MFKVNIKSNYTRCKRFYLHLTFCLSLINFEDKKYIISLTDTISLFV